jgi:hypothetical protein
VSGPTVDFKRLFKKISKADFIDRHHDKQHYFEAGAFENPSELFSWAKMNDLIQRSKLWDDRTIELALDGKVLQPSQYCRPGTDRYGDPIQKPDAERVKHFLRNGATMVLDFLEGIDPDIQAVAQCVERLTGTSTSCNAFCSWQRVQGYGSHFDTMCVVAIQIEGEKTWNLYRGRVGNPVMVPGLRAIDFTAEQHEQQKGPLLEQIVARPGDVLYIPRGQYHDALATDTASLHLSFGATYLAGFSAVSLLVQELQKDVFFRNRLPHFEDEQALADYLAEVGRRVAGLMATPEVHRLVRGYQLETLAEKLANPLLPNREPDDCFYVSRRPPALKRRGQAAFIDAASGPIEVPADLMAQIEMILGREVFWLSDLVFSSPTQVAAMQQIMAAMQKARVIFRARP